MKSIDVLKKLNNEKLFKEWKINLIRDFDLMIVHIENDFKIYESSFQLKQLKEFRLLSKYNSIEEIIKFLLNYIDKNKIKIIEKENLLNLKFLSDELNISNFELRINKKNILCEEIIEKLIKEIKNVRKENKELKLRIINLEKNENNIPKNYDSNKKIEQNIKIYPEISNEIPFSENLYNKKENNKNITLNNIELKEKNSIKKAHKDYIYSLSIFPSGNIISVSKDKSIKIYDNKFNIIQNISNAHEESITYVSIKDENNFVTCSSDQNIKIWNKMKNNLKSEYFFDLNQTINNAHDDSINKIIYCSNGNIISCSEDNKIKIWEENNNNNYQCIKILTHNDCVTSILLLEDKNILISSGNDGTKFWNLNKFKKTDHFDKVICFGVNALKRLDNDRIIIGGDDKKIINIISINERKIIKNIGNDFICWGICVIEDKGIFLIGGQSKVIKIYNSNNYECIKIFKDVHNNFIFGIKELTNENIISYGDKMINIWSFS